VSEYKVLHLFCGIGGAALGFQEARAEYRGMVGQFRTLAGIDCDAEACQDFEALTGAPAVQMDLFSHHDYIAFHGTMPPADWREVTPGDLLEVTGLEHPDVVFLSPPCKGFSGLLPSEKSKSEKYQSLNRLVVRGLQLVIDAYKDDLPAVIMLENVPRITSRGEFLLKQVKKLLGAHGYVFHEGAHDCGEIGGLAQHRKRYLLIARHPEKITSFIYRPHRQKVKAIGEAIGPLPMPDDPTMGPMHRLPRLQVKTWVRLALIPAGGDWRNLQDCGNYRIVHVPRNGAFGVQDWNGPSGVVTGQDGPNNATISVADPRLDHTPREGVYRILDWNEPSTTVTGAARVNTSNGAACISDPRLPDKQYHDGAYRVTPWENTSPTVTGGSPASSGGKCIADPRLNIKNGHQSLYRVVPWENPSGTITGAHGPNNGAITVADPRLPEKDVRYHNKYQVLDWNEPGTTVTGIADVQAGAQTIADPRLNERKNRRNNSYLVRPWESPAHTITGEDTLGSGAQSIADPRVAKFNHSYRVTPWDETAGTVTSGAAPSNGAITIADPRVTCKSRPNLFGVADWEQPISTISGSVSVSGSNAVGAVADPRLGCSPRNGTMGVQDWGKPAGTVIGAGDIHSGAAAVADPRLPADHERPDPPPIIIALDGTWHRPLTTLELAILQSLDPIMPDGRPLQLAGNSDARWRERIGNMVPRQSAKAIGEEILISFLASKVNDEWQLSAAGIWVNYFEESVNSIYQ